MSAVVLRIIFHGCTNQAGRGPKPEFFVCGADPPHPENLTYQSSLDNFWL